MQETLNQLIGLLQYSGIFGLMTVFASELIMPFAGFLAWHGAMSLEGVIISGALGSTFSSVIFYYGTRFIGHGQLYRFADRHGGWLGISARSVRRTERWFDRHARASVLVGRFFPGSRTAVSFVAGYRKMRLLPFVVYTAIGTAISTAVLALLGYYISDHYEGLQHITTYGSDAFLVVVFLVLMAYGYYRHRRYSR